MKVNKYITLLVAALCITETQGLAHCVTNGWNIFRLWTDSGQDDQLLDILPGLAYGFKGSYATTDCAT